MGYKKMSKVDVYEIFRRYHSGQTISEISVKEERDRKTIRQYIQKLEELGFNKAKPLPEREELFEAISMILPKTERSKRDYEELEDLADKFRDLVHDKEDGVFPKTAFKILKKQKDLKCSYNKGKIERMVPVGRELFRELKILNPGASLEEINRQIIALAGEGGSSEEDGIIPNLNNFLSLLGST